MDDAFGWLIFLVVAAVLLRPLYRGFLSGVRGNDDLPSPDYNLEVVGEASYQQNLLALAGPKGAESAELLVTATLVQEDSNPHDPMAVRVDVQGMTVGYLSRDNARHWRKRFRRTPLNCPAVIRGGWDRGKGDSGHFGVWLHAPKDFN